MIDTVNLLITIKELEEEVKHLHAEASANTQKAFGISWSIDKLKSDYEGAISIYLKRKEKEKLINS